MRVLICVAPTDGEIAPRNTKPRLGGGAGPGKPGNGDDWRLDTPRNRDSNQAPLLGQ